ncbi:hypothetical protein [Caulobacter sp. LARHSG274]
MRLSKTPQGRWAGHLERGAAAALAVGAHALLLALLARPVTLDFPDRSNDEGAVDVTLERPRRFAPAARGSDTRSPVPHRPAAAPPSTADALPLVPDAAPAANPTTSPTVGPAVALSGPRGDLGAALRAGGFACAGGRNALLAPEERARCQEKLGRLARNTPVLPAPIDPGKRAYYDAVAAAYDDHAPMVPLTARGAAGMFDVPASANSGHGPRIGCSVKFGPNAGKAPKGPPNALRAGPCFIQPPVGSLTPEVDIPRPY